MKAPASDHTDGRACTDRCMGICWARRYEHKSTVSIANRCDMRISAVIAGARCAEQSAFLHGGAGEAGMEVYYQEMKWRNTIMNQKNFYHHSLGNRPVSLPLLSAMGQCHSRY